MRPLRSGGQADTHLVRDSANPEGPLHVLKRMRLRSAFPSGQSVEKQLRRFKSEVGALAVLGEIGCPGIIRVVDSNLDPPTGAPWFVTPFFSAGAMRNGDRYLEPYRGDVSRILHVARDLAETLAFMHDTSPGWVHRDVKCGNIFFEHAGSRPTLGDFGLVYSPSEDGEETAVPERLGPAMWRPPELRRGGIAKRHPGSDIYMLGGVIFEALTGGESLDEIEHVGSHFAHEAPEFTIARFTNDRRVEHINLMLRGMFRRDPNLRLRAASVMSLCDSILSWHEGMPPPSADSIVNEAEEAAAEYRQRSTAIHNESLRQELDVTCERVANHFGDRQWAPLNRVTKMIDKNHGDTEPLRRLHALFPDSVWMAVRITVAFETHGPRPMFMSYVFVGRISTDREVVGVFDEEHKWRQLASGPPNDPRHLRLMIEAADAERARLLGKLAPAIRALK